MEEKLERILNSLKNYKETTNCKGVVLGISGGKDSTVVAMLAKLVWGENVVGLLMPNGEQTDLNDSIEICESIGLKYEIFNIANAYKEICSIGKGIQSEKAKSNIPPRIRMTILYAYAQNIGYRVLGTGNLSEISIGWFTKWGDGACDFDPISHLTCTEVVCLGCLLAEKFELDDRFIKKDPADGLTGKTDEENFGFSYTKLDKYILYGNSGNAEVNTKIEKLFSASEHKRRMPYSVSDYLKE